MLPFINSHTYALGVLSIMENEVVNRLNKVSESIVYKNEKLKAIKEKVVYQKQTIDELTQRLVKERENESQLDDQIIHIVLFIRVFI